MLRAIEILGIRKPVSIRWANESEMATKPKPGSGFRTTGEHEYTARDEHVIQLLPGRSAEATSKTVLHELAHAASAEAFPSRFAWQRAKLNDLQSFEDEADELAGVLAHLRPVT